MDNLERAKELCDLTTPKYFSRIEHVEPCDPCPICREIAAALDAAEERGKYEGVLEIWEKVNGKDVDYAYRVLMAMARKAEARPKEDRP